MKLKLVMLVSMFALGLAFSANAGSVTDTDSDLVPDSFDNCSSAANGPNQSPNNQIDTDVDGYGNWCDVDYNNDGLQDGGDFGLFVANFNTTSALHDANGDGLVDGADFGRFVALFNSVQVRRVWAAPARFLRSLGLR